MTVLVIGVGHALRRDDGLGPFVAERVGARGLTGMRAVCHHGEGTGLIDLWGEAERVVVVDATASGAPPGLVRVWDAAAGPLPAGLFPRSSHTFGLAEGVEMARLLGRLPPDFTVIGVEGGDFSAGEGLSPAVEEAAIGVVEDLARRYG
jgi:hydrogenase maturation protease